MRNLYFRNLILFLLISCAVTAQDGKFTFTLTGPANTSAGVFKADGTLVRTLWSSERYPSGTHTKSWDGKDDLGNKLTNPQSTYQVKVIIHNVSYKWQGTVGNTSDSMTGSAKHIGLYRCMSGLAFGTNYGYYCSGYSEGAPSIAKFDIKSPNSKIAMYGSINTGDINYVTTDGTNVYWGGFDPNVSNNSFVFATKTSDDTEVPFTTGRLFNSAYGRDYPYAISVVSQANALITGLAVQKTGIYLFVARSGINQLQVLNKSTGALVQTLAFNSPKGLSTDANNNLWMIWGRDSVQKFTVNSNGTLTGPVLSLSGLTEPLSTQVSPDGSTLGVVDGGSSQQVKFFNNNSGIPTNVMGTPGGYFVDATVADNKFYFSDINGLGSGQNAKFPFLAYQQDGTYWINDPGNSRVQHYSSTGTYQDRIMWMGSSYSVTADKNNISRVFSDFLEFEIDYSVQSLTGKSGWKLKKNWGVPVSSITYHRSPKHMTTLSNGRTYGVIRKTNDWEVVEFPSTGVIRFTGIILYGLTKIICDDGSLQDYTLAGQVATYKRYPLTGFTSSGNPIWSTTPEILVTATTDKLNGNPVNFPNTQVFTNTTKKVVLYNHKAWADNVGPIYSTGFHLGVIEKGTSDKWMFQTEKSTHRNYQGAYPKAGWFDVGNMVNDYAGSNVNIVDRQIISGYHGEFWKNGQTNMYNHYLDNGLVIGQFGTDREQAGYHSPAPAMMAGNALTPSLVKDASGDLYLWHGDESDHAAIHRWKISGVNSITEQLVTIPYPMAPVTAIHNFEDLMVNLPFDTTLPNNTAGWTRYPLKDSLINKFTDNWSVITSAYRYYSGVDLFIRYSQPTAQSYHVSRDLGTDTVKNDWKISGSVIFVCSGGTLNGQANNAYIDVLDANGKVLTTFYALKDMSAYPAVISKVFGNKSQILATATGIVTDDNKFDISIIKGVVQFNYAGYSATTVISDATGNWRRPKTLRLRFTSTGSTQNYNVRFDISDLKYYKDVMLAPANQVPTVDAGLDQIVHLPVTSATLDGFADDKDGTITNYAWAKIAGPTSGYVLSPTAASTEVSILLPGIYKFQLTVTDNNGATKSDTVQVTLLSPSNMAPEINAGSDQVLTLPSDNTTLSGTARDADGSIAGYRWAKISGPVGGSPSPLNTATTVISSLLSGTYVYEFIVTDDDGAVSRDTVNVTVLPAGNRGPIADAGANVTISLPLDNTTLTGIATDFDGTIRSYNWSQVSGPSVAFLAAPNAASTFVNKLLEGVYSFQLSVMDDAGAISRDTIVVTVTAVPNKVPQVFAGADLVITLPVDSIFLSGRATDVDGTVVSYQWLQVKGVSQAAIANSANSSTMVRGLKQGIYEFALKAIDNHGGFTLDSIQVTVIGLANMSPVANAGFDQLISLPVSSTTLTGSAIDLDGNISAYSWKKIAGPGTQVIDFAGAASTAVTGLQAGTYWFELTVIDNKFATGKDTVTITVQAAVNLIPVVDAGGDMELVLPQNSILLTGSGTDADGSVIKYQWKQVSGPTTALISLPASRSTNVSNFIEGTFKFELTVTDNAGGVASDTIVVTVRTAGNQAPKANAGSDQILYLPLNMLTLVGTGTDADGSVVGFGWSKIAGPTQGLILTPNAPSTLINNLAKGTYLYELVITDNNGALSRDTVQVTVQDAGNLAPVANAGESQTLVLPTNSTSLSGIGTDIDGTVAAYQWTKLSGPYGELIETPQQAFTFIRNLQEGIYVFQLSTKDNLGAEGSDTVEVIVEAHKNQAPFADAGADLVITLPIDSAILNGSAADIDGAIMKTNWTLVTGAATAQVLNPTRLTTKIDQLSAGVYLFQLSVTDNTGSVANDTVRITVNNPTNQRPLVNAGADTTIYLPNNKLTLRGTGIDPDGSITSYSWLKIAGPALGVIETPALVTTVVSNLVQGVYTFELSGTDNSGAISKSLVNVTVLTTLNQPPTALAGNDQVLQLPTNSTSLHASGMDADGTIVSYNWLKISGPTQGTILGPGSASTAIIELTEGVYNYQLIIKDNNGATAKDTVTITVLGAANLAPTVNAGPDKNISLPSTDVTLVGTAADSDGIIVSYSWTKISGPASAVIATASSGTTSVINLVVGVYQFQLTVTDDRGSVAKDTVAVTLTPATNEPPTAEAGIDKFILLPVNTATLSGNGNDLDGFVVSYLWRKISGPAAGTTATPTSATTALNSLVKGVYLYEFVVTDNEGAVGKDTIQVIVDDAINQLPVADAGLNKTITIPVNSINLSGTATDIDGTITSYFWTKVSGPAGAIISTPNLLNTNISGMTAGLYEFTLTVIDDDGGVGKDTVRITVNDGQNLAPVANAGTNKVVTLPVNSTTLNGSGTDADGTIGKYSWVKISGPATGTIVSPGAPVTSITNLSYGTYKFELTVTDNEGAISKDVVDVSVISLSNLAPVAKAGADQVLILPKRSTTLQGGGIDLDGSIDRFTWTKISGPQGTLTSPNSSSPTIKNLEQGVYVFELTVRDNEGAVGVDRVQITVTTAGSTASNTPPVANAGADKIVMLPVSNTTLDGSGVDLDGTISSYEWTKLSGPSSGTIVSTGSGTTAVTSLVPGVYHFVLTVKDNGGAIGTDTVEVVVSEAPNERPLADAGMDQDLTLPVVATSLYGLGIDPDGTIADYHWSIISGPASGKVYSPNSATTAIGELVPGKYTIELTVTDNKGATAKDSLYINITPDANQSPTAYAGAAQEISLPINSAVLNGSGVDNDGVITGYLWEQLSGPAPAGFSTANTAVLKLSNLVEGIYQFELTVTDNDGAIGKEIVQLTVTSARNQAPVANAGRDVNTTLPVNSSALHGSGFDVDGKIISYRWNKISGPATGIITLPNEESTSIVNLSEGLYTYQLTVTDDKGAIGIDTVVVTVYPAASNAAPVANAGIDKVITLPTTSSTLTGAGTDIDGSVISYAWKKISGPAAGNIAAPNSAITMLNSLAEGTYLFELTVTDNAGAVTTDTAQVIVNPAPNQPPVANAGSDKVISLPLNTISLAGTGSDADGVVVSYIWRKVSGPASAILDSPAIAVTSVNQLLEGIYHFELMVTDNQGLSSSDTVKVTVYSASNIAPVAEAGGDKTVYLPVNIGLLQGHGTDIDGEIVTYRWSKISGPSAGIIDNEDKDTTSIRELTEGTYFYQLSVTDNNGTMSRDTVKVTVLAANNQLPVAQGGDDKIVILPLNSTTLSGAGTDSDGVIVSYKWTKVGGPPNGIISLANAPLTAINDLQEGTYYYELTVTDNNGASGRDTIKIVVKGETKIAPTVNAGEDQVIFLPLNSATLTGTAADANGTIVTYLWSQVTGPAGATISAGGLPITMVSGLVEGSYYYQLKVTDNQGEAGYDTVKVTVMVGGRQRPVANAGSDRIISLPTNSVTLAGTGVDADGVIKSYSWIHLDGPSASVMAAPMYAITPVNELVAGVYHFELTVTDNDGLSSKDTVSITVNATPNKPPSVSAGIDQVVTLPVNTTILSGSGSDPDGSIINLQWSKIGGAGAAVITSSGLGSAVVSNLEAGVYLFELLATDNLGGIARDTVKVTVDSAFNYLPVANAGLDSVITLPANTVTLRGSGTDSDGTINSYSWIKISGPSSGRIQTPFASTTVISDMVEGIYIYKLTVIDNQGAIGRDTVVILVNPFKNDRPVANAGADMDIILPVNSVTLKGIGKDPDGVISAYQWKVLSGPNGYAFTNADSATTKIDSLFQGVYEVELTVKDDRGATATDTMKITVSSPRLAPYTDAVKLYPNPVTSIGNVDITTAEANIKVSVAVTNALGMLVKYTEFNMPGNTYSYKLDTSNLTAGGYFVTVRYGKKQIVTIKMLKMN